MATRHPRVKAGDVLELRAGNRYAYLHYIGKHPEYGDAVVVDPRLQQRHRTADRKHFSGAYVAFYPVAAAVAQGLVEVVAHLPPSNLPSRLRRAGVRSGAQVNSWVIEDGSHEIVKVTLSEEELQLPIAAIWNHDLLVQRIAEGWTPAKEGGG